MVNRQSGMAGIFIILLIFFILTGGLIGADFAYIEYTTKCGDTPIGECLQATPTPTPNPQTTVTAIGSFSKAGYGANITMNVPLAGGPVSGSFNGACSGSITGTYDGQDNGVISGSARGSCNPFVVPVPASATFTGTVNKSSQTIFIDGQGSAAGFSGSGSLTLNF